MALVAAGLVSVLLLGVGQLAAEEPRAIDPRIAQRIRQLEEETAALRSELAAIQQRPFRLPETSGSQIEQTSAISADPLTSPAAGGGVSMDLVRAEAKKWAWTKGDFTITPYGILWATMTYETAQTNSTDYVLYVLPKTTDGDDVFSVDGRSTRLGLDVAGPRVPFFCCAQSGGKVELDFQRNIDTENRASVLLRHAYVEVKNEEFRLLFGQTWDVFSPLYPGMLMYTVGWSGGNIGYRRPQLRGERYYDVSDNLAVIFQAAAARDVAGLFDNQSGVAFQRADWPVVQARTGITVGPRGKGCLPWDFGVSGHVGETIYDFAAPFAAEKNLHAKTWSANADFRMPLSHRFGVQGELFVGENLGTYWGGIMQTIDIGTSANQGSRDPIRSAGGWIDFWYDLTPRLHTHVGYSLDDPLNEDLTTGRTYNQFFFGNIAYDLTAKFLVGFEVTDWTTNWIGSGEAESVNMAMVAKYGF